MGDISTGLMGDISTRGWVGMGLRRVSRSCWLGIRGMRRNRSCGLRRDGSMGMGIKTMLVWRSSWVREEVGCARAYARLGIDPGVIGRERSWDEVGTIGRQVWEMECISACRYLRNVIDGFGPIGNYYFNLCSSNWAH